MLRRMPHLLVIWNMWRFIMSHLLKSNSISAPPGCLQYYPETTGTYESFNYNGGLGPYIANLNYAICFRRNADTCGIR